MKHTKVCPKCGASNVLFVPGTIGPCGSGNNIQVGMLITSAVLVNRYICTSCGYCEEWIDEKDLPKIQKKFSK